MHLSDPPHSVLERMPALAARFRMASSTRAAREKPHVLVVEDSLFSRKIIEEVLRQDTVAEMAPSAKEGLKLYLETAPDIVFLDIELTDESGHTLARFIKSADPTTFVVMVTGSNSVEDVALARGNKVDGFIVKPYGKAKLLDCIEAYFKAHPTRRPKG